MLVLVIYDVKTQDRAGRRRFRRVARACLDFGQKVQFSVFECEADPSQWAALSERLIEEIDADCDSLRFCQLGAEGRKKIEHVGAKASLDLQGPLLI